VFDARTCNEPSDKKTLIPPNRLIFPFMDYFSNRFNRREKPLGIGPVILAGKYFDNSAASRKMGFKCCAISRGHFGDQRVTNETPGPCYTPHQLCLCHMFLPITLIYRTLFILFRRITLPVNVVLAAGHVNEESPIKPAGLQLSACGNIRQKADRVGENHNANVENLFFRR